MDAMQSLVVGAKCLQLAHLKFAGLPWCTRTLPRNFNLFRVRRIILYKIRSILNYYCLRSNFQPLFSKLIATLWLVQAIAETQPIGDTAEYAVVSRKNCQTAAANHDCSQSDSSDVLETLLTRPICCEFFL